ncbi:leucine-rich repeat receptor-like serine/threonine-protein kinase [Canna indica]|uniref:non-specific serine/threonine protein kinase n=1 Tax=Canna indica TaxID=4628 RepID=A0AAQ3QHA3_9LILI|nr:leucine-rich repeat receptor-like serine/threonine-protein kinase [Canna indica]
MKRRSFSPALQFWGLILLQFSVAAFLVRGQSITQSLGFVFIDCGIPANSTYADPNSGITYVSDEQFTDSGINNNVWYGYVNNLARRYYTVRSFPDGNRNCYNFNSIIPGTKYLIRAIFLYGNYDNKNSTLQFDLYLNVNLWKTINVTDPSKYHLTEVVTVATAHRISVCLVNTGQGTPFISGLDLRPINSSLYSSVNALGTDLVLLTRHNLGGNDIRFPVDPYDRYWLDDGEDIPSSFKKMNTNSSIQYLADDPFQVPSPVMQSAIYNSSRLEIILKPVDFGDLNEYFALMHFCELQSLPQDASRQFFVFLNDALLNDGKSFGPEFLYPRSIFNKDPITGFSDRYINISLGQTSNSTLPPILNAIEVFSAMRNTNNATDARDVHIYVLLFTTLAIPVDAMMGIKEFYQVKKNWNGDPCAPKIYVGWIELNLSNSGLAGEISTFFANLSAIQYLDLSHNDLTGPIPAAIAYLPSLKFLNLTNNQLNGSIPSALLTKSQSGALTLRFEGNPNICFNVSSCETKLRERRKNRAPVLTIVVSCIVPPIVIFSLLTVTICILIKRQASRTVITERLQSEGTLEVENRKYTYMDLERITNNFKKILGEGGFGTVYYGHLEDGTEVAVKMLFQASSQGNKEFLAEVQHLTRVHHKNLVSMIGYCKDGDHRALVFEFMSQGTLKEHLKGICSDTPLTWRQRLQIALQAAQGLEYLHTGCKPPLVHRDVKSTNILLNERLEAKISDFGLTKAFQNDSHSHVTTKVCGTPGYVDPEYYIKNQLSQKSDVYSFGVVLLELLTGHPPVIDDAEGSHIMEWVRQRLAKGNIEDIVDERLQLEYDMNSSWKVANLALLCTAQSSHERPTMAEVVTQLKECLALYNAGNGTQFQFTHNSEIFNAKYSDKNQINAHEFQEALYDSGTDGPSLR